MWAQTLTATKTADKFLEPQLPLLWSIHTALSKGRLDEMQMTTAITFKYHLLYASYS